MNPPKKIKPGLEITFTIYSIAEPLELILRKTIEDKINPLVFAKIPFSKEQKERNFTSDKIKTVDFTEVVYEKNRKRSVELFANNEGDTFFAPGDQGKRIPIVSKKVDTRPSLLENLEMFPDGIEVRTSMLFEIFAPNMKSWTKYNSTGRGRIWYLSFLIKKKDGTKYTFIISKINLEEKSFRVTRETKRQL